MAKAAHQKTSSNYEKMLVSIPRPLAAEMKRYADIVRGGNKSGFVADAVEAYIQAMRRQRRIKKLRKSYAAAAQHSLAISAEWQKIDEEAWQKLDALDTT